MDCRVPSSKDVCHAASRPHPRNIGYGSQFPWHFFNKLSVCFCFYVGLSSPLQILVHGQKPAPSRLFAKATSFSTILLAGMPLGRVFCMCRVGRDQLNHESRAMYHIRLQCLYGFYMDHKPFKGLFSPQGLGCCASYQLKGALS